GDMDAAIYFELGGYASSHTLTTTVDVQSGPSKDENFFLARQTTNGVAALARFTVTTSTSLGVQNIVINRWSTEANSQVLGKHTRFYVTFATQASLQATITF